MNAEQLRNTVTDAASEGMQSLHTAYARGKEQIQHIEEQAVESCKNAARQTDEYVRSNPWQAVGIAAGIGLVVGLLVSRR